MSTIPYVLASITGASFLGGKAIAQSQTITYDSPIALGIGIAAVSAAFTVGVVLTGIKRDIKELKEKIQDLPCHECRSEERK